MKKSLKRLVAAALAAAMALGVCMFGVSAQEFNVTELIPDGVTLAAGSECDALTGWTSYSAEGNTMTTGTVGEDSVVQFNRTIDGNARGSYAFSAVTGDFVVQARFQKSNVNTRLEVFDTNGTTLTYVDLDTPKSGFNVNVGSGTNSNTNRTFPFDTETEWNVVTLHFHAARATFDTYLNGTKMTSEEPLRGMVSMTGTSSVRVSALDALGTASVDYVHIYTINTKVNTAPEAGSAQITGIPTSGRTLAAAYDYTDADGDIEGHSEVAWYISDTESGEYTPIAGATGGRLTVLPTYAGKYIKFRVTPVDIFGNKGSYVESAAVKELSTVTDLYRSDFATEDGTGWTFVPGSDTSSTRYAAIDNASSALKVFSSDSESTTVTTATRSLDKTDMTGDLYLEFEVKVDPGFTQSDPRSIFIAKIQQGNYDAVALNYYHENGEYRLRLNMNSARYTTVYNLSDWTRIGILLNTTSKAAAFYINGTLMKSDAIFENTDKISADKGMTALQFGACRNGASATMDMQYRNMSFVHVQPYNSAPAAEDVTVSGTANVGQTLTAGYTFQDADGDSEGASTYRWYAAGSAEAQFNPIDEATARTLTVPVGMANAYVKLGVTPVDAYGKAGSEVLSAPVLVRAVTDGKLDEKYNDGTAEDNTAGYSFSSGEEGQCAIAWENNSIAISNTSTTTDARYQKNLENVPTAPFALEMSLKNTGGDSSVNILNGEAAIIDFIGNTLHVQHLSGVKVITDSYDPAHTYRFRLVFRSLTGVSANDVFDVFVDDVYYGAYNCRRDGQTSINRFNVYKKANSGEGKLYIDDLLVYNIDPTAIYSDITASWTYGDSAGEPSDAPVAGGTAELALTVTRELPVESAVLITTVYSDGVLLSAVTKPVTAGELAQGVTASVNIPETATGELSLRSFLWDSLESMRPLTEAIN